MRRLLTAASNTCNVVPTMSDTPLQKIQQLLQVQSTVGQVQPPVSSSTAEAVHSIGGQAKRARQPDGM